MTHKFKIEVYAPCVACTTTRGNMKYRLTSNYRPRVAHNIKAYMAVRALFKECKYVPLEKNALASVVPKTHPIGTGAQFIEYLANMGAIERV